MDLIIEFTPHDHLSSSKMVEELTLNENFQKFMRGNDGKRIKATFSPAVKQSEKERLYNYYHKVILGVAIQVYTNDGWTEVDKVKADYLLKAECGKGIMFNSKTGQEEIYLLDKSRMNKDRLYKFISDCITFLEVEKGAIVPESSTYLMEMRTGISGFRSLNSKKSL